MNASAGEAKWETPLDAIRVIGGEQKEVRGVGKIFEQREV
jgi:hypothetical protein